MKKVLSIMLLALVTVVGFTSCTKDTTTQTSAKTETITTSTTEKEVEINYPDSALTIVVPYAAGGAAGGLVLDKIKELGLDENTLIVWTTDHGDAVASHGGHFDKVSYMTQEVMRIPMAMKWKGIIDEGTVNSNLVCNLDMPETMLDAAGLKFNQKVHGRTLLDLFRENSDSWRTGLMCETNGHGYIERIAGRMFVKDDWKYVWFENQKEEMYNLKDDPFEMTNLVDFPEYDSKKEELKTLLITEEIRTDDPVMIN